MGMYDTIDSEQVKCFGCDLKHYSKGETVPCAEFNYKNNILIMPIETRLDDFWESSSFIFIRDSKVYEYKTIREITDDDFEYAEEVLTYTGTKMKITSLNDLFNYIEDIMVMGVKEEVDRLRGGCNDYYESFELKWSCKLR